ncbi:conserved hypothetical protein [Thermotomaculum hydrothermale]|uniref:Cys-tRNA(Pro)/Cys-tRNA(Cys) deacylase n=1 Tax=Thermotomaculum hydrothermale TaxID=981385 RepID=A0A7R6PRU6_9BACT|nr:YbaK/EbsC family protein [Thermotomaculum hydrothermale]BBB33176.1 conserved hypothetical protein [Thermotomaculum hydrothermale]
MKTRGIEFLEKNRVEHKVFTYDHKVKGAEFAAEQTGIELERMIKTLVVCDVRGKDFYFVLMPGDKSVDMKKLAKCLGKKKMRMSTVQEAQKLTNYLVGGISPFGAKTKLPVVMEKSLEQFEKVGINGGGRGIIVEISLNDLKSLLNPEVCEVAKS